MVLKMTEEISKTDRECLLNGLHKELIDLFRAYFDDGKREFDCVKKTTEESLQYYLKMPFSFSSTLYEVVQDAEIIETNLKNRRNSEKENMERKIYEKNDDGWRKTKEDIYNKNIFVLGKHLNFFNSVIMKICQNNIDKVVIDKVKNIDDIKAAFEWLMIDVSEAETVDIQDVNRLENLLRKQIIKYYHSEEKMFYFAEMKKTIDVALSDFREYSVRQTRGELHRYKMRARKYLDDIFFFYKKIYNYWELTLSAETDELLKIVRDSEGTKQIVLLAETIKRSLIQHFMTFVKIDELNLPQTVMNNADFNHTDFSEGSYIKSTIRFSNIQKSVWHNCDLSICDFFASDAYGADFSGSNFNYANLTAAVFNNANLSNCQLNSVLIRSPKVDFSADNVSTLITNLSLIDKEKSKMAKDLNFHMDVCRGKAKEIKDKYRKKIEERNKEKYEKYVFDEEEIYTGWHIKSEFLKQIDFQEFGTTVEKAAIGAVTSVDENDVVNEDKETNLLLGNGETIMERPIKEYLNPLLEDLITLHKSRIVWRDLLEILILAEKTESFKKREERESDFGEMNLRAARFQNAKITNSSMPEIDLSHVNFSSVTLDGTDLDKAIMYYTDAGQSSFVGTNLSGAVVFQSDFAGTTLVKSNLNNATVVDSVFSNTSFANAVFLDAVFLNTKRKESFLKEILKPGKGDQRESRVFNEIEHPLFGREKEENARDMQGVVFASSVGIGASFVNMNMDKSRFDNADFKNVKLFNCICRWSFFNKTDLTYSTIIGVSFHQSAMKETILSMARFFATTFTGCQLSGATIVSAKIDKTLLYNTEVSGTNFSSTHFNNCAIKDIIFENVDFSYTIFKDVAFSNVSFKGCKGLDSAQFKRCVFHKCYNVNGRSLGSDMSSLYKESVVKEEETILWLTENTKVTLDQRGGGCLMKDKFCTYSNMYYGKREEEDDDL